MSKDISQREATEPEHSTTKPQLKVRVRNRLLNYFLTFCCVVVVGVIFDRFGEKEFLEGHFKGFYDSVTKLNPLNIVRYLLDAFDFFFFHLDAWISSVLPATLANGIMKVLFLPLWAFVIGGAWLILPITVFVEGDIIEFVLVLIVFVPMALLVLGSTPDDNSAFPFVGMCLAVAATSLVFWIVQLSAKGAYFLAGGSDGVIAGSSTIGSCVYWCLTKSAEHSVTERLVHAVRHVVARLIGK